MYNIAALRRTLKRLDHRNKVKCNIFGGISVYTSSGGYLGFIGRHCNFVQHNRIRPKRERLIKLCLMLIVVASFALLQGCSFGIYSGEKSTLIGIEFGTKSAFEGLEHHRDADTFDLSIQSRSKDSTEGLAAIVEGVVRGVKP